MKTFLLTVPFLLGQIQVTTSDGSILRGEVLPSEIVFETKWGTIKVPFKDVAGLSLAPRIPADQEGAVRSSLEALGGSGYREREAAQKHLLDLGIGAWWKLKRHPAADPETKKRVELVLKQLGDEPSVEDELRTVLGVFHGKVVNKGFNVKNRCLGELILPIHSISEIRVRQLVELEVDASSAGWVGTGAFALTSSEIELSAAGVADLWPQQPGQYVTGPKGYSTVGRNSSFAGGALLMRVGQGDPILAGEKLHHRCERGGEIKLILAPNPWENAKTIGRYKVKVEVK